jgi:hypothetical protein
MTATIERRCYLWALTCGAIGLGALLACHVPAAMGADGPAPGQPTWYKGNTHAHSVWSDGDDFPEMVADWYKTHGYKFFALSDHNTLQRGQNWRDVFDKKKPVSPQAIDKCRKRFGDAWVETRGEGQKLQVRLKTLDEIRAKLEEPGKFLLIENEEITGKCGALEVHLNAVNLAEVIQPRKAPTVLDTLRADLQAVAEQSRRLRRPIVAHVNHPNWRWFDISAEDLAGAVEARFFEVCNSSPTTNCLGDDKHPSVDRLWDIANTLRIAKMKRPPLYGTASDDAHSYHVFGPQHGNPGRGWIMVRAKELSTEAILEAMERGDFYASTGVLLREVRYDRQAGTLTVEIDPQPGAQYTIEFYGTLTGYDPKTELAPVTDKNGKPRPPVHRYSADVGKLLLRVQGTRAVYTLTGKELYVRASVRSSQRMPNPPKDEGQFQQAWCQPVGWENWVH